MSPTPVDGSSPAAASRPTSPLPAQVTHGTGQDITGPASSQEPVVRAPSRLEAAGSSPSASIRLATRLPPEEEAQLVRQVREKVIEPHRDFHGTDLEGQASIRRFGFIADRQQAGGGGGDEPTGIHHVTPRKRQAKLYALGRAAAAGDVTTARLVRTIGFRDLPFVDWEDEGGGAYTAAQDVPRELGHVFPAKQEPMDEATARIVQRLIRSEMAMEVSTARAADLGDQARSDSEDDFDHRRA